MKLPTPSEVKAAREAAGLTQAQAAALVISDLRSWQRWEDETSGTSARQMHPGLFKLFLLQTGQISLAPKPH